MCVWVSVSTHYLQRILNVCSLGMGHCVSWAWNYFIFSAFYSIEANWSSLLCVHTNWNSPAGRGRQALVHAYKHIRVSIICTKQDNKKPASTKTNQEKDTWIRWFWNWMCLRTTRIAPCALTMYRMKYSFWNLFSDCKSNTKKTWCLLRPSYVNTDNSFQTQRLAYQSFNLKCSFPKSIPYFLGDT